MKTDKGIVIYKEMSDFSNQLSRPHHKLRTFLISIVLIIVLLSVGCASGDTKPTVRPDRVQRTRNFLPTPNARVVIPSNSTAVGADEAACELFQAGMKNLDEVYGNEIPFGMNLKQYYRVAISELKIAHRYSKTADSEIRLGLTYLLDGIEYDDDAGTFANSKRLEKRCGELGHPVAY